MGLKILREFVAVVVIAVVGVGDGGGGGLGGSGGGGDCICVEIGRSEIPLSIFPGESYQ